ncbi:MAG: Acetolactate synthase large subunit [Chloroflexi bacterium]|nr:MAG: Acetolactate synthase large subunit [Chloroflexota bacterium]
MAKVSGSQLITNCLGILGIDTVFTVAGNHTLLLMDTMHNSDIRLVDTRHEQDAVDVANVGVELNINPASLCSPRQDTRMLFLG